MTDRPIQWRVQDGSIIIGNNGLGTAVCYSASLHEVYRSIVSRVLKKQFAFWEEEDQLYKWVFAFMQKRINICLFRRCYRAFAALLALLLMCPDACYSVVFYKNPFTNYQLKGVSTSMSWKFISLIFLIVSFFQIPPKKFLIFHLIVFLQTFLSPF